MSTHLGTTNFLEVPTVNGVNVLTSATGLLNGSLSVLQVLVGNIPIATGTAQVPWDNSTPQITEGTQLWTRSFTPISATSQILIFQNITVSHGTNTRVITTSFFAGNTNIGAAGTLCATNSQPYSLGLSVIHAPGNTNPITFSCRAGANGNGTAYFNQTVGGNLGGVTVTEYVIMEIAL